MVPAVSVQLPKAPGPLPPRFYTPRPPTPWSAGRKSHTTFLSTGLLFGKQGRPHMSVPCRSPRGGESHNQGRVPTLQMAAACVVPLPRQWAQRSLSAPLPLHPVLPASGSSERSQPGASRLVGWPGGQPSVGEQGPRRPRPPARPPAGPRAHPVRLQLFPLAQATEEGLLLPAQRLPGGQEHRAPHVEPHPLAPAARRAAARPRRRRCLSGLHPHRSPRRLHPPLAAPRAGTRRGARREL
jgi:hypothetical protein